MVQEITTPRIGLGESTMNREGMLWKRLTGGTVEGDEELAEYVLIIIEKLKNYSCLTHRRMK